MPSEINIDRLQTSNQLTPIYGHSPYNKSGKGDSDFFRGIILYIGGENVLIGNLKHLNPRMVYYDFDQNIKNQDELEIAVLNYGRAGLLGRSVPGKPFPDVHSASLSVVHYGWKPCIITYILDVPSYEFQLQDASLDPASLNQPVVFRRDKIIVDDRGSPHAYGFLGNFGTSEYGTFSDLRHHSVGPEVKSASHVSTFRFYDHMIDPQGRQIEKPDNWQESEPFEYCMDMYIRTEQGRKLYAFSDAELAALSSADNDVRNNALVKMGPPISQFLTMVFDPPQTNGGGSGPP